MNHREVIKKWTMFGFNYPYNFIEKVFGDESTAMVNHLKWKFNECHQIYGAAGSFFIFWAELDGKHKEKLENWVMDR